MRKLIALATGTVLSLTMVVGSHVSADAHERGVHRKPGVGTIHWGRCADPDLVAGGARCGMLAVPLDYARPYGAKIQLAVSRVRHTVPKSQYQGVTLVNPGGPGGSGLFFALTGGWVPNGAGAAYDWIGWDPRGVGLSVPALSCIPGYNAGPRPPYVPTTHRIERAWLNRSRAYARACGRNGGALLDHVKSVDNVRDMDAIRSALGARTINYYGFSYGTTLGQTYATKYPSRVRRFVLDSNVDPRDLWYPANVAQDYAFESVIQKFFDWVASYDTVYHLGTTGAAVSAKYYAVLDVLAKHPKGELGPSELSDAFLYAGYVQWSWPIVGTAFADLLNNNDADTAKLLYEAFDGPGNDNGYAMYLATECTDAHWPHDYYGFWKPDTNRIATDAPFFAWPNAWFNAPCIFWPARSAHPLEVAASPGLPGMLLIDETLDAATPYEGSLEVRRRFPSAVLLAEPGGTTHAGSLGGNACVDDTVARYLTDGTLPTRKPGDGPDATCDPLPLPVPDELAAATGQGGSSRHSLSRLAAQGGLRAQGRAG